MIITVPVYQAMNYLHALIPELLAYYFSKQLKRFLQIFQEKGPVFSNTFCNPKYIPTPFFFIKYLRLKYVN